MSDRTSNANNQDFEIMERGRGENARGMDANDYALAPYDAKTGAELRAEADEGTGAGGYPHDDSQWRALQAFVQSRENETGGDGFNWWAFGALVILALAGLYLAVVFLWGMI